MSVQRWTMQHLVGKVGLTLDADSNGEWVTYSDHARIVAEAQARWVEIARQDRMAAHQRGAQEAERQHAKALADMEQAHAAALADVRVPAWQNGYDAGYTQARGDAEVRRVVEVAAAAATEHYEREAGR